MRTITAYSDRQMKIINGKRKAEQKARKKANIDYMKEVHNQIGIVSGSVGIALYENWGWREKRLQKLFSEIKESWEECAADKNISMLEMCENETGIVIDRQGFEVDYKELRYFKPGDISEQDEMSLCEFMYMRSQQKKWAGPQVFASVLLTLHRLYGFGAERIIRLKEQMEDVWTRYGSDCKKIEKACQEITGVSISR